MSHALQPTALQPTHHRERLELPPRVRKYLENPGRAPRREGQPARFRPAMFGYWAAFAIALVTAFAAEGGVAILGGLAAFTLFWIGVTALIHDARIPDPRNRSTAALAARCWSQALRFGHFRKAYSCHHPDLLPDDLWIDAMPTLAMIGGQHSLSSYGGFKKMWKSLIGSTGGTNRVVKKALVGEPIVQGNVAECEVYLEVVRYGSWVYAGLLLGVIPLLLLYLIDRRVATIRMELQLFRHGDQWWVVPPLPEETSYSRPADRLPRASLR